MMGQIYVQKKEIENKVRIQKVVYPNNLGRPLLFLT